MLKGQIVSMRMMQSLLDKFDKQINNFRRKNIRINIYYGRISYLDGWLCVVYSIHMIS